MSEIIISPLAAAFPASFAATLHFIQVVVYAKLVSNSSLPFPSLIKIAAFMSHSSLL